VCVEWRDRNSIQLLFVRNSKGGWPVSSRIQFKVDSEVLNHKRHFGLSIDRQSNQPFRCRHSVLFIS
jgi:hypothetical protein